MSINLFFFFFFFLKDGWSGSAKKERYPIARRKGARKHLDTLFHDTTEYFHGLSLNLIDATRNVNVFS